MSSQSAIRAYFGNRLDDMAPGELEQLGEFVDQHGALPIPSQLVFDGDTTHLVSERTGEVLWSSMPVPTIQPNGHTDQHAKSNGQTLEQRVGTAVRPVGRLADGAQDLIRQRLGNDFFKLTRTQFQEVVAMYLSGNSWLTNDRPLRVVDEYGHRYLFTDRDDGSEVCPVSWPLEAFNRLHWQARQELARRDQDYNPRGHQTDVDKVRVALVEGELASELTSDFTTDTDQFDLDPCYGRPLPYPVVRTYNSRVLNFNGAMVTAVRAQHDGVMPRHAGILVHRTKPQLAIQFSVDPRPGYHLVSPKSDYNSYRVHAQSAILRVQCRLREDPDKFGHTLDELMNLAKQVNGRRRCHQVGDLWVVDYTEDLL